MGMEWKTPLIAALLAVATLPAQARVSALCLVSFLTENGWSRERRVEVEFFSTRELFPDDRDFPIYAKIWYNPEDPAVVALGGTSLVSPEIPIATFRKLFSDGQALQGREREDPQRWRVRAFVRGQWVDPRFPADFEEPLRLPPRYH